MRIGTRRVGDAELGRAVAKDEIALRSVQKIMAPGGGRLPCQPFHGGLKRNRIDRLKSGRGRGHCAAPVETSHQTTRMPSIFAIIGSLPAKSKRSKSRGIAPCVLSENHKSGQIFVGMTSSLS